MTGFSMRLAGLVLPVLAASCAAAPPPDYSPNYSYVSTAGGGQTLAPDACLAEPADKPPERKSLIGPLTPELGPHLPPGCANAYNLQQMAENKGDLVSGRKMGPASGAVTARAARRYIYGDEAPTGGANPGDLPPPQSSTDTP